jgi:hypothetical protein
MANEEINTMIYIYIYTCIYIYIYTLAAVQHIFTHKQYTEYRERNVHNNQKIKNIQQYKIN